MLGESVCAAADSRKLPFLQRQRSCPRPGAPLFRQEIKITRSQKQLDKLKYQRIREMIGQQAASDK